MSWSERKGFQLSMHCFRIFERDGATSLLSVAPVARVSKKVRSRETRLRRSNRKVLSELPMAAVCTKAKSTTNSLVLGRRQRAEVNKVSNFVPRINSMKLRGYTWWVSVRRVMGLHCSSDIKSCVNTYRRILVKRRNKWERDERSVSYSSEVKFSDYSPYRPTYSFRLANHSRMTVWDRSPGWFVRVRCLSKSVSGSYAMDINANPT